MRFAPMNYHHLRYPVKKFPDKVKGSSFNNIDLYYPAPQPSIFDYSLNRLIELDWDVRQRNLKVMAMTPKSCVCPTSFYTQDPVIRQSSIRYYQRVIDTAEFLGCPNIQISTGFGYLDQPREEAWKYCRESLTQLAVYCQRKQARLSLKGLEVTTTNVLITNKDMAGMLDEVDSPCIAGMVGMGQMTHAGEIVDDYLGHLGERLMHVHFNDRGHTVPGHGDLPMKEYYDAIERRGYDGVVSFEIYDRKYCYDPDKTVDSIVSWMKENIHELGDVMEEIWYVDS